MLIETQMANQMEEAIDGTFRSLPDIYRTDEIKLEIARAVAFSALLPCSRTKRCYSESSRPLIAR